LKGFEIFENVRPNLMQKFMKPI